MANAANVDQFEYRAIGSLIDLIECDGNRQSYAAIGQGTQPPRLAQLELATCLARGSDIQRLS